MGLSRSASGRGTWAKPGVHEAKDTEFEICHGDTLTNAWGILRELNTA
jgi:hypothetical protein